MGYAMTPLVGVQDAEVNPQASQGKGFGLGDSYIGDDGHLWVHAQAAGAVAGGAAVVLTEPAMTIASGAGAFTYPGTVALASGDRAWVRKTAI